MSDGISKSVPSSDNWRKILPSKYDEPDLNKSQKSRAKTPTVSKFDQLGHISLNNFKQIFYYSSRSKCPCEQ